MIGRASAWGRREDFGWAMLAAGMLPPESGFYRARAPAICGHFSLLVRARPGNRQVWACDACGAGTLHELDWSEPKRPRFWMFAGGELARVKRKSGRAQ